MNKPIATTTTITTDDEFTTHKHAATFIAPNGNVHSIHFTLAVCNDVQPTDIVITQDMTSGVDPVYYIGGVTNNVSTASNVQDELAFVAKDGKRFSDERSLKKYENKLKSQSGWKRGSKKW